MIEVSPEPLTFSPDYPAGLHCIGVLNRILPGRVLVDYVVRQIRAVARDSTFDTIYLAEIWMVETLKVLMTTLRRLSWLVACEDRYHALMHVPPCCKLVISTAIKPSGIGLLRIVLQWPWQDAKWVSRNAHRQTKETGIGSDLAAIGKGRADGNSLAKAGTE